MNFARIAALAMAIPSGLTGEALYWAADRVSSDFVMTQCPTLHDVIAVSNFGYADMPEEEDLSDEDARYWWMQDLNENSIFDADEWQSALYCSARLALTSHLLVAYMAAVV